MFILLNYLFGEYIKIFFSIKFICILIINSETLLQRKVDIYITKRSKLKIFNKKEKSLKHLNWIRKHCNLIANYQLTSLRFEQTKDITGENAFWNRLHLVEILAQEIDTSTKYLFTCYGFFSSSSLLVNLIKQTCTGTDLRNRNLK